VILGDRADADDYVPGHGDMTYDVTHYDLQVTYAVNGNRLKGLATLTLVALQELDRLRLDLHALDVDRVLVGGKPVKYSRKRDQLTVRLAEPVATGHELQVTVRYAGNPRPARKRHLGSAGWEELTDGVIVAGQPHGASSWFPCNDRPSNKARYRITVTTSSDYSVIANGVLVHRRKDSRTTTWVYDQSEPMATYLATVQIGRYEDVEIKDAVVPLRIAAPKELVGRLHGAFGQQAEMLACFVEMFGDYPFDGYRVVVTEDDLEIPLESQGLSTFGSNHLRGDWETVRLVAHELSHQWFGNSLTVGAWKDIWLHEGFACYSEWLWSERSGDRSAAEHADEHWKRLHGLDQDLVLSDPGPDLMFDDRVYKRGALFLQALRTTVGDDRFFATVAAWVASNAYGTVDTDHFVEFFASRTGSAAVRPLARTWLNQPRLPALPQPA
jgi:aminopeptidase N